MSGQVANDEQARYWSEHAPAWLEVELAFEEVGRPPGLAAMDLLELSAGMRVLDIGWGSGGTTVELARRVAPGGLAMGADIAEELLAPARERAAAAGVVTTEFVLADAQAHDFGEAAFDAAYSRFGVMFFADPVAAFANIRRAVRPGGGLAFVCWQQVFANEWVLVPAVAAIGVLGMVPTPPSADQPGPFSLAEPERVQALLSEAGWRDVVIDSRTEPVELDEGRLAQVARASTRMGAVRELLDGADDALREQVAQAIEAALRERVHDGVAHLARAVHLVSARA